MSDNWRKYDTAPENVRIRIKCEWFNNPQKTIVVEALRQEDGVHFEDGFGLNYNWTPVEWTELSALPGGEGGNGSKEG